MVISECSFNITACNFINNRIVNGSGGVAAVSTSSFNITHSTFINNSALIGGTLATKRCWFIIDACTFADNNHNATLFAGIFDIDESLVKVNNSTFTNNGAVGGGGVIVTISSSTELTNCSFTDNSLLNGGGSVLVITSLYLNSTTTVISDCTFRNN